MQMKQEPSPSMRKAPLATNQKSLSRKGFSLVEIILANAVFALLVTGLIGAYLYGQESTALAGNRGRAVLLAEEGLEAVRNIRDAGFANLTNGTYGLTRVSNQWNLSGLSDAVDIFTRQVIISSVDTKRKLITTNVTWEQNPQRNGLVSLGSRLTNWIDLGIGNWSQEASLNLADDDNGIKVQVLGNYAYIVRDGGTDFVVIDISNPASPTVAGSLSLAGTLSNLFVSGNYAYVTSNDNSEELIIVNISTPSSPSVVGTFNNTGIQNATGVYVVGTTAYVTFGGNDELSIINVSVPSTPTIVSTLNLTSNLNEIVISGNYAYVASDNNSEELQVIDISNPLLPTQVGSLNLSGNDNATTIAIAGSVLLIGQGSTFHTVNITTPTAPLALGSISTSGTTNDIALNTGNANTYAYIATTDDTLEVQVIDVSAPAIPALLGSVNTAGTDNLNGVAYDETLDRTFLIGDSNNEEFIIIRRQ